MTNALRVELAEKKITVAALHVGYMDTDMAAHIDPSGKTDPAIVARVALDGIAAGEHEILADDLSKQVRALTDGRGADLAVECVGRPATIRQAWGCARRGGRTVIVGVGSNDDRVDWGALELFYFARSITGCIYGNTDPDRDVPRLIEAWRAGRLDLEALVTDRCDLGGVDGAFERMRSGHGGRTVLIPG